MTKRNTEGSTDVITKVLVSGMYTKSCVSKILRSYGDCQSSLHSDLPHIGRPRSVSLHLIPQNTAKWRASLSTITSEKGRTSHRTKMHPMLTTFTTECKLWFFAPKLSTPTGDFVMDTRRYRSPLMGPDLLVHFLEMNNSQLYIIGYTW